MVNFSVLCKKSVFVAACIAAIAFAFGVQQLVATQSANAASYSVSSGPLFNNPYGSSAEQRKIIDQVKNAIANTPKNSVIRIATYSIRDKSVYEAIKKVYKWDKEKKKETGAIVQIVIDDHSYYQDKDDDTMNADETKDTAMIEDLKDLLGTDTSDLTKSFIKVCTTSCLSNSPYATQHAKFYMFSTTGKSKLVSMVSSSNLSPGHAHAWNDMYRVVGNETLYNDLKAYFYLLVKDKATYDYQNIKISDTMRLYTFPRDVDDNSDDVHYTMLSKIKCTGMASGYGYNGKTVINIAMYKWLDSRDDVARKLRDLADDGCIVKVLTSQENIDKGIVKILLAPNGSKASTIQIKGADYKKDDDHDYYMHSKFIVINGYYNDPELTDKQKGSAKIVFMGSPNLSSTGIQSNSEVMLRLRSSSVQAAYNKQFSTMWNNSHSKAIKYVDPN